MKSSPLVPAAPDRSIAFFSRDAGRSESSMLACTVLALLLVLVVLVIGDPA